MLAGLLALGLPGSAARAAAPGVVVHALQPIAYEDARAALLDAMVDEGLAPPGINPFGEMLARTAPDLGHRADFFEHAEIFSFCSARISARLVTEDRHNIALCPLTIALYTLPAKPQTVFLSYRKPAIASTGGRLAHALLRRLVNRTRENGGLPR
ncbi:MAG TPA: DUF302 domain-containing protein [Aromatoleum sp.]|uniref:DUF302 domain-containing protein n=1 Tax=Aromatoleum sp. TaxID=2307007 RepID=UPI002B469831|nr:DUF302 domain-containing protein [Aromatoleum sp.]HJV25243.1 DUF302 domain-containing protein [Aromatoleum sp.]